MLLLIVIALGLILGSFATALVYRVPLGISWIQSGGMASRSACPHCKALLGWRDLIPVYSWFAAQGKCRHCGAPIGAMYPFVEISVLILCMLAFWVRGPEIETAFIILAVPFLMALLVIDYKSFILPDQLIFILAGLGLVRAVVFGFYAHSLMIPVMAILSAMIFGGLLWAVGWGTGRLLKKEALGFGDVKFFAMAGLWIGLDDLAMYCFIAGFLGIFFSLFWKTKKGEALFPFGPSLISAFYLLLLVQSSLFA